MICTGSGRKALLSALLASAALSVASSAAVAADQIETVVVTGTMLHNQTASPVQVVTSAQIDASGLTSTADVIRSLSADNSGTIPTAFGNGFAAGASGVALRGLTVNSTLVLINGRRTANYPLADDGERGFVDGFAIFIFRLGKRDDEDRVFGGQTDQCNQANLGINVICKGRYQR